MSNTKHTPEPWEAHGATIQTTDGHFLFVAVDSTLNGARISDEEQEANAQRIVECVNACAGLDDPKDYLDRMNTIGVIQVYKDLLKIAKQRDQLVAACEEAIRMYLNTAPAGGWQGVYEQIQDAIAEAKGGRS